jgi:hypothetical protein
MCISPLCVIELHAAAALHHVLERTQLISFLSARVAEVGLLARSIFGVALLSERRPCVVGLISIRSKSLVSGSACFWKGPPREVQFV